MQINLADTLSEVEQAFARYQKALLENDVDTLDALFWNDPRTVRYGSAENLYGFEEIAAFRAARPRAGLGRDIVRTVITSYGRDLATTNIEFIPKNSQRLGRQSQTWVRMPQGWRVVSAHVSFMDRAT